MILEAVPEAGRHEPPHAAGDETGTGETDSTDAPACPNCGKPSWPVLTIRRNPTDREVARAMEIIRKRGPPRPHETTRRQRQKACSKSSGPGTAPGPLVPVAPNRHKRREMSPSPDPILPPETGQTHRSGHAAPEDPPHQTGSTDQAETPNQLSTRGQGRAWRGFVQTGLVSAFQPTLTMILGSAIRVGPG